MELFFKNLFYCIYQPILTWRKCSAKADHLMPLKSVPIPSGNLENERRLHLPK